MAPNIWSSTVWRIIGPASLLFSAAAGAEAPRWRFDLEAAYSDLTQDRDPWREAAIRAAYRADEMISLLAGIEAAWRFDKFDAYLEARVDARLDGETSLYMLAGGTPDADFRPRIAFGTGGAQHLFKDDGLIAAAVATLDVRYAEYTSGNVETANLGLELYALKGRAWLAARLINIWDETGVHRTGYFLRADIQPAETLTLFAGYADAPDTSDGVTVDTTSWFAGLAYDADEDLTLRLALAQEMREMGYDRTTLTFSLTLRR